MGLACPQAVVAPASDRMSCVALETGLRRLTLRRFRSYLSLDAAFDARPVVLFGPNGSGKTNLLEAISLLAPGRGLRRARLADVSHRPHPEEEATGGWAVSAHLAAEAAPVQIGTGLESGEKRTVRINEAAAAPADLAQWLRILWLTPAMDRLFIEAASGRRRFLDRMVLGFDSAHGARSLAYERAVRQRLQLLKDGRQERAWLEALEQAMAEHGTAIAVARVAFVARLQAAVDATGTELSRHFPAGDLALDGSLENALGAGLAPATVQNEFAARLAQTRYRDAQSGRTAEGPHLSDLLVRHREKCMPAAECSTGEQKALLIGLVLAQARLMAAQQGGTPLLLLDEVAAHLDAARRAALFDAVCALGQQVFMTGTDKTLFESFAGRAQRFEVVDSRIAVVRGA